MLISHRLSLKMWIFALRCQLRPRHHQRIRLPILALAPRKKRKKPDLRNLGEKNRVGKAVSKNNTRGGVYFILLDVRN